MFRYDLYGKKFDCAWNRGVKWMYSSSLMRVKVLENMSQYKVKQAVKKKKPKNHSKNWNESSVPGKVCMGSLTGENHSTYTVILRACGNEATTWWDGRWAWVAAIYVVFIPSCAPGGEMNVEHCYCLTPVCWSIYMCLRMHNWVLENNSRHSISVHTSSITSEFIP